MQIFGSGITSNSEPWGITVGADHNLWFTENVPSGRIGRMTTSGAVTEFPVSTTSGAPFGITSGPDGNLWFTEQVYGGAPTKVGVMNPNGQMLTEIDIASSGVGLSGITVAGSRIWFTETTANAIGWIDVAAKTFNPGSQLVADGTAGPASIISRADGFVYFIEAGIRADSLPHTHERAIAHPLPHVTNGVPAPTGISATACARAPGGGATGCRPPTEGSSTSAMPGSSARPAPST